MIPKEASRPLAAADSEARSGPEAKPAIRHTGDKAAREALRRLKPKPKDAAPPEPPPAEAAPAPEPPSSMPVKAGDDLAALARKRRRKRKGGGG